MGSFFDGIVGWAKKPYSGDMDWKGWGLFVGFLLVLTILWSMVLRDLRGAVT